ncbi:MAG: T9SS type A sorting domain-containing protein [Lishizhenia sp.]
MKKLLLSAAAILGIGLSAFTQCSWTLNGADSYGDGWNGGSLAILDGGVPVAGSPFAVSGSSGTWTFPVTDGNTIELNWTAGGYLSEVSFSLLDADGALVHNQPSGPSSGQVYSGPIACDIPCAVPLNFSVVGSTGITTDLTWDNNPAAIGSDFIVEYGVTGFTPGTFLNIVNVFGSTSAQVVGLTPGTIYDYYVYRDCGTDTTSGAGPLTITAECGVPSLLVLDDADLTSADVSWTSVASEFSIEYGLSGFTPGSGFTQVETTTTSNIQGLVSNSFYEVYVRTICGPGDTSDYVGPIEFNTYNQAAFMDFDTQCPTAGFIDISSTGTDLNLTDDGEANINPLPFPVLYQQLLMTTARIGNNGGMQLGSTTANIGSGGNFNTLPDGTLFPWGDDLDEETGNVYWETIGTAPNRILVIQWDNICNFSGNPTAPTVTFQVQIEEATNEIYYVYDDVVFGGSNVGDDFAANASIGASGPNQDITISDDDPVFLQNNSCARLYYTDCPNVVDLSTVGYFSDTIIVSWNAGLAGETNWTIEYGPAGFTPGTGTTFTTTNTQDTIGGLTQLTDYDVYVYSDCDITLQSVGAVITTQTAPVCATPFGVSANGLQDSISVTWDWTVGAPTSLPTGFNIQYILQGQPLYTGMTVTSDILFDDTIVDAGLLYGAYYDVYVQAVCGADTSLYSTPNTALIPALNDSTCFAVDLAIDGTVYQFSNLNTGVSTGEAAIAPPATGFQTPDGWGASTLVETTWFTFTAPASGNVLISGLDNNQTTKMAVYEVTDCGDYNTFTLVGANDNDIEVPFQNAPFYIQCGLTPGAQYYLLHSNESTFTNNNYSIALTEIDYNAGSFVTDLDACLGDTVDMFNTITGYDLEYGTWLENQFTAQLNDEFFATTVLASNTYAFEYRVQRQCAYDSVTANITIFPPSNAGQDGNITVCLNQPTNLFSALNGNADLGGTWFDPQDVALPNATPSASNILGQFNYDYISGNGVCPDDTALVVVTVDGTCDYLGLDENKLEGISIFPNPTSDIVTIASENNEVLSVEITDVNGRVVFTSNEKLTFGTELIINVAAFENGIYMINLRNENVANTYRLVKN